MYIFRKAEGELSFSTWRYTSSSRFFFSWIIVLDLFPMLWACGRGAKFQKNCRASSNLVFFCFFGRGRFAKLLNILQDTSDKLMGLTCNQCILVYDFFFIRKYRRNNNNNNNRTEAAQGVQTREPPKENSV